MTPVTIDGFLSKKEIEASYGRSFRSLTRDITRAVREGDTDVLRHLKLVTDDNKTREGSEVTLEMIQELSNNGLRPMWLAEESWVAEWCDRRSKRRRSRHEPSDELNDPSPRNEPSASDYRRPLIDSPQSPTIELLQHRIDDQKQQIDTLRGQLQIKDDQIRSANQLAQQNQELMRNLQVLLKNVQDGLLGEGTRQLMSAKAATIPISGPTSLTVAESPSAPGPPKPQRLPKSTTHRKNTGVKRSTPGKPAAAAPAPGRLQRWFPALVKRRKAD